MIDARILNVNAVSDLRDRLEWEVQLTFPRYTEKGIDTVVHFDWEGDIAFYRKPMAANSLGPNPDPNRRSLAARWEAPIRAHASMGKARESAPWTLHLSTAVEIATLERLERFRGGGRLYARVEGYLKLLYASQFDRQLKELNVSLRENIMSEAYELPPHQWNEEILPQLFPPGKFLVEVDASAGLGEPFLPRTQLERARTAFNAGRFDDMARELYTFVERLPSTKTSGGNDDPRHHLNGIHKNLKALLNLYRHRQAEVQPLTRAVAQFLLLAVMQSDVFGIPAREEG